MTPALSHALNALEDANKRYIHACRAHLSDLLSMLTSDDVALYLLEIDMVEREQNELVERIRELAEAEA